MRVALLGTLALLVLGGVTSCAASAAGPYWRVNEARLEKGSKQVTITAGATELKAKLLAIPLTILCEAASVEGASIIGNGTGQGQDKTAAINFEKCKLVAPSKCVVEPIKTVPVKSHLVTLGGGKQILDLFEPTTGKEFTTITFVNGSETCPVAGKFPVTGKIAAEVKPEEAEVKSGELAFPGTPIKEVKKEGGVEEVVGLEIGKGNAASFSGKFATELESGESFGVFAS